MALGKFMKIDNKSQLDERLDYLKKDLADTWDWSQPVCIRPIAYENPRTPTQNNCLHEYCGNLATDLNNAGFEMAKFFEIKKVDVPWTKTAVKEAVWKPVQEAMFSKESTTRLNTKEFSAVYEVLARHIAQSYGVTTPWPTRFNGG